MSLLALLKLSLILFSETLKFLLFILQLSLQPLNSHGFNFELSLTDFLLFQTGFKRFRDALLLNGHFRSFLLQTLLQEFDFVGEGEDLTILSFHVYLKVDHFFIDEIAIILIVFNDLVTSLTCMRL